jgi:hypothetical protein
MKVVSGDFTTRSQADSRKLLGKSEIDWNLNGTFTDESDHQQVITIERKINEPLGGISIAMADVELINHDDRYTPPSSS